MDPITATTTVITLASFIKDLIDVGQSIKRSIEKVRENRRRIRELTVDILSTLAKLADLSRMNQDTFQAPAHLSALGDLKADMLHVLSICSKISPPQPSPGFRGLGSQIKVWMKRDDVEAEIRRLKKHVNKCYLEFTAFSTARIEQKTTRIEDATRLAANTSLRVEHAVVVQAVENQVRLRRLEGMMAQVLLDTQFGQNVTDQMIGIIESLTGLSKDVTHQTLEFQYLSTETLRLADSLQQRTVILDTSLWDGESVVLAPFESPKHILHKVLGVLVKINDCPGEISFTTIEGLLYLGNRLARLGMHSESTAWYLAAIQILRRLAGGAFHAEALPHIVHLLAQLSSHYQSQLRQDLAVKNSQQSVDLCRVLCEISPDVDHRSLLGTILITHSDNLRATGQLEVAISTAQEAIAIARSLLGQSLASSSWTTQEQCKGTKYSEALFCLAEAYADVHQYLEAYEAWRQGFQTMLRFSGSIPSPTDIEIDYFLDDMCKMAEGEEFSLAMLADCTILFRDLSRIYSEEFSSQFLRLLNAYAYLSRQSNRSADTDTSLKHLRSFLEPDPGSPPPVLELPNDFTLYLEGFNVYGGLVEDAIRAFFLCPTQVTIHALIRNIFVGHFDRALVVLRGLVENSCSDLSFNPHTLWWVLYSILDIGLYVPDSKQLILLGIMTEIIKYLAMIIKPALPETRDWLLNTMLPQTVCILWSAGLLDKALVVSDTAINHLCSCSDIDNSDVGANDKLRWYQLCRTFVLCEMFRIPEAIEMLKIIYPNPIIRGTNNAGTFLRRWLIRTRILRQMEGDPETLRMLRRVPLDSQTHSTTGSHTSNLHLHILLAELAEAVGRAGWIQRATSVAERVVETCRKEVDVDFADQQKFALAHSLAIFSDCLAAVGRNEEALQAAEEATRIYNLDVSHMRVDFVATIRREELGANTHHTLSLRLRTSGMLEEALWNAKKATKLYREAAACARQHFSALATSLLNVASITSRVWRGNDSISACEEAVSILRQVRDAETALAEALDQLAGYHSENGDAERAAAATSEAVEVRRKIESLPPQPFFLFSEFEMESESEDDGGATATESDDEEEYHDATTDLEVVFSEVACATSAQELPSATQAVEAGVESCCSPSAASHAAVLSMGEAATPPIILESHGEERVANDTAKDRVTDILGTPLEVKFQLSSTPMDLLWWILLVILSVAFVWSRGQ
ncbi:hypothetical protein FB451DRAFT_1369467 [Mycena latifolia]|nr:hypothetical protein FB451DRAFT_1369467 [Mycena latifolia]